MGVCLFVTWATCGYVNADEPVESVRQLATNLRGSEQHDALQGEIMGEGSVGEHLTARIGVSFFLSDATGLHGGLEGGLRGGLPGRVSPFVGMGMFLGTWSD